MLLPTLLLSPARTLIKVIPLVTYGCASGGSAAVPGAVAAAPSSLVGYAQLRGSWEAGGISSE